MINEEQPALTKILNINIGDTRLTFPRNKKIAINKESSNARSKAEIRFRLSA